MIKIENVSKSYKLDDGETVTGIKNISFEEPGVHYHNLFQDI